MSVMASQITSISNVCSTICLDVDPWWRHQMETFSALLAICVGNSPVASEFPAQRPVTQSFDVFFDLLLNKQLSKQSRGLWFEMLSCPLWRHCNAKKTSKVHITGLCDGNPPVAGGFPSQRASNAENVSIWWCHHVFNKWQQQKQTNKKMGYGLLWAQAP